MNVGTDEAEKFKTDLDLDGRVNSVEPTDHHHDQDDNNDYNDDDCNSAFDDDQMMMSFCETEGEQTSDQGKSNRKNSRGKFRSKIPVKMSNTKYIQFRS